MHNSVMKSQHLHQGCSYKIEQFSYACISAMMWNYSRLLVFISYPGFFKYNVDRKTLLVYLRRCIKDVLLAFGKGKKRLNIQIYTFFDIMSYSHHSLSSKFYSGIVKGYMDSQCENSFWSGPTNGILKAVNVFRRGAGRKKSREWRSLAFCLSSTSEEK